MELNADFIEIQGIMRGIETTPGEYTKIKYISGNESKIQLVTNELYKFLVSRHYITQKKSINTAFDKQIADIVMFLVLNSEFKDEKALDIKEYSHLVNIMPVFSKCLLCSVIIDLELGDYYGRAMQMLPVHLSAEMMKETIPCLKRKSPEIALQQVFVIIREIIKKLSGVDTTIFKVREAADELTIICSELLLQITGFNPENLNSYSKSQVYAHMGYTLLKLFKLLQYCQIENEALAIIIEKLLSATSSIVQGVTINVFCAWAAIKHGDEALQVAVGTEAYHILEKYTKCKQAKEHIQMLVHIARKPETLQETIQGASIETMIKKINKIDADQRQWFIALLNTQVFDNPDAMSCLNKWYHICTVEDVNRLLTLSKDHKTAEVKKLVLKCTSNLPVEDLTLLMTRFFRLYGTGNHLEYQNIRGDLIRRLNKIHADNSSSELGHDSIKEIALLLLQNPEDVTEILCGECVKNAVYSTWLKRAFSVLSNILTIDMLAVKSLKTVLETSELTSENFVGCANLIQMLAETECCSYNNLFDQIVKPTITNAFQDDRDADLKIGLLILNELKSEQFSNKIKTELMALLIEILEAKRCSFVSFSILKVEITIASVNALKSLRLSEDFHAQCNAVNKYYSHPTTDSYLYFVYPDFNIENYGDAVSKLVQLLSRCVPDEWTMITDDVCSRFGAQKTLEILTDFLILVCQVTSTQSETENVVTFNALKYYLQNYGICVKNLQDKRKKLEFEVIAVENIFRLLRAIPPSIRYNEGVNLIPLLSDNALKQKRNEKQFICSLIEIDPELSKIIAKRILA